MSRGQDDQSRTADELVRPGSGMNSVPCVIFLHIGKTAGTTFRIVIDRHFKHGQIYTVPKGRPDAPGRPPREGTLRDFARLPEERRRSFRLIQGHTIYGLHEMVPGPSTYITLLRNPTALVMSQYNYVLRWRSHHLHDTVVSQAMSLREYIESGVSLEMDNSQTRAIAGDVGTPFGQCSRDMLEKAKHNIERHFTLVGLTERFDETLILLGEAFGWSKLHYVRSNVAPRTQRASVVRETMEVIEEHNRLDAELYEYAAGRLEEAMDLDTRFDRKLRRLHRANSFYRPWGSLTYTLPKRAYHRIKGKGRVDPGPGL